MIHCVVGAKRTLVDSPCNSTSSALFFAGIQVLTPVLNMSRKGETTLRIRPTIPYATHTLELPTYNLEDTGELSISLDFPENIISDCTIAGSSRTCEIKIPSFKYSERHKYNDRSQWYKEYTMTIQNKDSLGYEIDNSVLLRLKTIGGGEKAAKVFEGVLLPDVPINIIDDHTEWKGKYCYSHADPHMRTFDKYKYECQDEGCKTGITSVLYQNKEHDQEVHVRHHKCFWPNARCICALAARSGRDVFIFDACNGRRYINFPICDDKSLKVVKVTDMSYKIFFPTGTYVTTTLYMYSDWFLQTQVYPSVADVGKSSGLCGVLGGGMQNDLTRRDGTLDDPNSFSYHNPPNDFSISWRVSASEDLLSALMDFQTLNSLSLIKTQLCTCNEEKKTECSYRSYTDCGTTTRGKEYQCLLHSSSSRRKRHAEYMASFNPDPVEASTPLRVRRQAAYTDEEVIVICNAEFDNSIPFQTCIEHVADFSNDSIQNCIADVSLTGNPNLTSFHLESAISECQTLINLNSTLQKEKPSITYEILNVCPSNCSKHGECSGGNCTCNAGFGGSDCSFDITSPPRVASLLGNGLCDLSGDTCDDVTMFGHFFVENMNTTCFMTRKEVFTNVIQMKYVLMYIFIRLRKKENK
ncbi:von Willebrand factor D and EGF domain-containing protein-like [Saccostrea echinata]|uniref:von Willebrand factor D and EGF domain-containing protein-like n=1 Tax=Saccostrea echinata TaxID=191078 RepID=UPI002A82BA19|nr:von Willebrand factor D and EGF domain-containing protein-like [Saccostrea echinata]